jgi:hypothetical protein
MSTFEITGDLMAVAKDAATAAFLRGEDATRAVVEAVAPAIQAAHPLSAMADEDRQWLYEHVLAGFHGEFCEYDGEEDGQPVCAGECREFAERASGLTADEIERGAR